MSSKRNHESTETSTSSSDDDSSVSKKKKYHQAFRMEYSSAFPSIRPSRQGPKFAHCTTCKTDFSVAHGGRYDCKKHCETSSHKRLQKGHENTTTLTAFCQRSSSPSLQNQVTRAEAVMCSLVAELNLPLSTADTLTRALPKMFPDSKIAAG